MLDDELVVCEGKFFDAFRLPRLNDQLRSQRQQVLYLFAARHFRAYRHVAILPLEPASSPDCDVVLTWSDIIKLSEQVLGADDYVTSRLPAAADSYSKLLGEPGVPNYEGILPLDDVLRKCESLEESIQVGYVGGVGDLLSRPLEYLEAKLWKWRNHHITPGPVIPRNWIPGAEFVARIHQRREEAEEANSSPHL